MKMNFYLKINESYVIAISVSPRTEGHLNRERERERGGGSKEKTKAGWKKNKQYLSYVI